MANEDIIKQWVVDKLGEEGFSLKAGNLAKESAQQTFPALYDAMTHASKKQNGNRGAADFSFFGQWERNKQSVSYFDRD